MSLSPRRRLAILPSLLAFLPSLAFAAWRSEGPFAANVSSVAIAPSKPDTVYAATSNGGVFRSRDGGATWTLPGDEMTSRDVQWVAVDPADSESVWVGLEASGSGSALWRSKDGGATWSVVDDDYPGGSVHATGAPITFAPAPSKTIYVASSNLHYRTDDGGKSWKDFRVPNQDAYVFAVHPTDAKIVYAGGRGDNQNIARSTDGGKTWRQVGVGLGKNSVRALFVDPATPTTLYAAAGTFAQIFKSADEGATWKVLALPVGGTSDLYGFTVDSKGRLWAATEDGLLSSSDGGSTWTKSERGTGRYWLKTVAVDPRDPAKLVAGAGGDGVYRSSDGGGSWTHSSQGMAAAWVERIWGDPRSATLFVKLATGLYRLEGGAWSEVTEPFASGEEADVDGFLFDASNPKSMYAFSGSKYWTSADSGRKWQEVAQKEPSMRDLMKGNTEQAQFSSLAQDAGNPKTLYAGSWSNDADGGAVYKSTDGGKKWSPSGSGLPSEKVGLLRTGAPGTLFALVSENGLYRTTNGGGSWSTAMSGMPGDAKIHELALNPKNPSQLFAATDKGLFRSSDAAASWSKASGIEDEEVRAVAVDPASGTVYAGAFHGVFVSKDGGESWKAANESLPNTDVRALAVAGSPPRLWAGTAGGSLFSTELP